jgi:hypothetical protein
LSTSSEEKMHERDAWDKVLPVKTKVSRFLKDV